MSEVCTPFCINKMTDLLAIVVQLILVTFIAVPEGVFCFFSYLFFKLYSIPHLQYILVVRWCALKVLENRRCIERADLWVVKL